MLENRASQGVKLARSSANYSGLGEVAATNITPQLRIVGAAAKTICTGIFLIRVQQWLFAAKFGGTRL
jgi:hypothetical protein